MPARRTVIERARGPALAPAPRAALAELQIRARAAVIPAVCDRGIDELQQPVLRGRLDPSRDPATQSQRPFPSASINLTPISFNASESRAISALRRRQLRVRAVARPDSRLGLRQRLQRALARHRPELHDRRAIHPAALGRGRDRVLAADQAQPDLVLLARRQEPLAAPTPAGRYRCHWTADRSSSLAPGCARQAPRCGLITAREVWREVRRKPG